MKKPPKRVLIYILLVPTVFVAACTLLKHFALDTPFVRSSEASAQEAVRAADESERAFEHQSNMPAPTTSASPMPSPVADPGKQAEKEAVKRMDAILLNAKEQDEKLQMEYATTKLCIAQEELYKFNHSKRDEPDAECKKRLQKLKHEADQVGR